MNIKRILLATLAITVLGIIVGGATCGSTFNWVYKLEPISVWRPMDTICWGFMYGGMFVLDLVLVYVYALLKSALPGKNKYIKGIVFGVIVWAVGILPGMLSTHVFMTVASTVVIYWTIFGILNNILKGLVIAAIVGE